MRLELRANDAARSVRPHHLAPNRAVRRPLLLRLRLVHIAQLLTTVERRRRGVRHALELNERRVVVLVRARALVPQNQPSHIQSIAIRRARRSSVVAFANIPRRTTRPDSRAPPPRVVVAPRAHRR